MSESERASERASERERDREREREREREITRARVSENGGDGAREGRAREKKRVRGIEE